MGHGAAALFVCSKKVTAGMITFAAALFAAATNAEVIADAGGDDNLLNFEDVQNREDL